VAERFAGQSVVGIAAARAETDSPLGLSVRDGVAQLIDPDAGAGAFAPSYVCGLALPADRALIVTGSLFAHQLDRCLQREQIWPVQVILDGIVRRVPFFDDKGSMGISALAFADDGQIPASIFYSTGADLAEFNPVTGDVVEHPVERLIDVHEMLFDRGAVHIANTGNDEIVSYSPQTRECRRSSLAPFRSGARPAEADGYVDRFHANQAFRGLDGKLWVLVHHVAGWQRLRRVMGKMLKGQGDGGVINLDENRGVALNLSSPHSVRVVRGEYWVMNSGHHEVNVYSPDWRKLRSFACCGWGRGMDANGNVVYGGMSPRRKRYLSIFERFDPRCWLQAFDATSGEPLGQVVIQNMEQVNNIYCVNRAFALSLLSL
jgi:Domain of unknown function (DUF4915)